MKMKLNLVIACLACFTFKAHAQAQVLTTVRGHVDKENVKTVFLYKAVDGEMLEYASSRLDTDNNFAFAIPQVSTGFYYVGNNLKGRPVYGRVYLKPGEAVTIDIHEKDFTLSGKSAENKLLAEWQKMYAEIAIPSFQFWSGSTVYVTFFPLLKSFLPKAAAFKKKINSPDKSFNQFLSFVVDSDIEHAALNFIYTPRSAHPSKEEYPDYYSTIIKPGKYSDTKLLRLGDGMRRLKFYSQYYCMNTDSAVEKRSSRYYQDCGMNALNNDTLKGLSIVNNLARYKTLEKLQEAVAAYRKYFVTDSINAKYLRYESGLASYAAGEKAFNFSYPDVNGKNVSLADLKGKVVFVDTWATWCAPCRVEIPHLKKLEEEFKDKNVAFVSISVDVEKDHQKWLDFIKKENLGGIQLFASGWSQFAQYYKITGIPRFLIIDQKGNIVDADSPRPSQPELKEILEKLVKG